MGIVGGASGTAFKLAERAVVALESVAKNMSEMEEIPDIDGQLQRKELKIKLTTYQKSFTALNDILDNDSLDQFQKFQRLRKLSSEWYKAMKDTSEKLEALPDE